jgi:ABC-type transport system substrate-binding protein
MTSADVVYSWERLFDPALASPATDFFDVIEGSDARMDGTADHLSGLSAPDGMTVVARLKEPDRTFANVVAMLFGAVVPKEEVERLGDDWALTPVGTGPFEVEERDIGERATFVANRDYWEPGIPYLDRITFLSQIPRATGFLKLEADEVQEITRISGPDYLWLKQQPAWADRMVDTPAPDTYGEMMNTEMPPFDNVWFRRAVSSAIDRDKLAKVRNQRIRATSSFLPPGMPGYDEDVPYQKYDLAVARDCMAKAGYPDGYPETIEYWVLTDETSVLMALSVQSDLARIGIHVELKPVSFPVYLTASARRKTVRFAYCSWNMDYPDPSNFLDPKFKCSARAEENSNNESFYCNPAVDELLVRAHREPDADTRAALYTQAQRIIGADAPWVWEYHSDNVSVTQPYVKGFRNHPVWPRDPTRAWLDLADGRPSP